MSLRARARFAPVCVLSETRELVRTPRLPPFFEKLLIFEQGRRWQYRVLYGTRYCRSWYCSDIAKDLIGRQFTDPPEGERNYTSNMRLSWFIHTECTEMFVPVTMYRRSVLLARPHLRWLSAVAARGGSV